MRKKREFNKFISQCIAIILLFTFCYEGYMWRSPMRTADAAANNHVEQVKKLASYIQKHGEKEQEGKKYYIGWDGVNTNGYAVEIYRKTPNRLLFSFYYPNLTNGVIISTQSELTGKTKTMKFRINIYNVSNSKQSKTIASIKDISKYKGNTASIQVNKSDIASISPNITEKQTERLMNTIIDSALDGINWTLYFNQIEEREKILLRDLGFNKKYTLKQ